MLFTWLRNRRRRRLRASAPVEDWRTLLADRVWQFAGLSDEEQERLCRHAAVILAEKYWEGCNGLELTDEMKRIIAAQVALMTLGFDEQYFDRVRSLLIYPEPYEAPVQQPAGGGFIIEGRDARIGEAWYRGPVILSWPDVEAGSRSPHGGHNLVVHEFAHQLDTLNGRDADGVPVIADLQRAERWQAVCDEAFRRLQRQCSGPPRGGRRPALDCYGATDRAEFFAVASEAFFQTPGRLAQIEPELFAIFREYFGQDPRRWVP